VQLKIGSHEQNSDLSDIGEVWTEVLPHESTVRFPLVSTIPPIPPTPFIFETADIGRTNGQIRGSANKSGNIKTENYSRTSSEC